MLLFYPTNKILIFSAIIPAIILLISIYKTDKYDKEPIGLVMSLIFLGIASTFSAIILEFIGESIICSFTNENTLLYNILMYFIVVAFAEEWSKYFFLKLRTWKSKDFNYIFDGIVYSVFISLGFALWENIGYVLSNGLGTVDVSWTDGNTILCAMPYEDYEYMRNQNSELFFKQGNYVLYKMKLKLRH